MLKSENNIKFNVYLLEGNPNAVYNFSKRVNVVYIDEKFGYHKFMNLGRKMGKAEYVVLCNNDLTYETGWATNIICEMKKEPDLLSASPFEPKNNSKSEPSYGYITGKASKRLVYLSKKKDL